MALPEYICSEVDFPICRVLELEPTKYQSSYATILGIKIQSPYTFITLLITVACAIRMINHVNSLYASIGRGEMRTLFCLYIVSNLLQVVTVCFGHYIHDKIFMFLTVLQTSFYSTMFFGLFVSALTIDRIYGILGVKSSTFMRVLVSIYFGVISSFVFLCSTIKNVYMIVIMFIINSISLLFYLSFQMKKLKHTKSDIWAFGVLGIIFMFFCLSTLHTLVGAQLVAVLSERSLDSLFFVTVYNFFMVMMVHKYWLNTCDFELECLALNV